MEALQELQQKDPFATQLGDPWQTFHNWMDANGIDWQAEDWDWQESIERYSQDCKAEELTPILPGLMPAEVTHEG